MYVAEAVKEMIHKARDSRSTNYEQDKCNDMMKPTPKYIIVELQETKKDWEILKVARGGKYYIQRGKDQTVTADFLVETVESNNFKLSVLLQSAKIFVRNEDSLLVHLTSIPMEGDQERQKISGGRSRTQGEKKQQKYVGKSK